MLERFLTVDLFAALFLLPQLEQTALYMDLNTDLGCWRCISIYEPTLSSACIKEMRGIQGLDWFPGLFWFLFCQPAPVALLAPWPLRAKTLPSNPRGTVDSLEFLLQVDQGKPTYGCSLPVGGTRWYIPRSTTPNTQNHQRATDCMHDPSSVINMHCTGTSTGRQVNPGHCKLSPVGSNMS